ncbi:zinc metallopeptidase [Engelhardtia mirabilis]|uniref:Neutral zinc metallopeptidase n=1 Tax=Engelhardtia mirabilis TaxID=2528011 RepID=A0A518BQ46_9BACT|nr:Putative neutral zinc metallopeptidase [Planctomycetes bacterium Pla133]QDV03426.1 Putative neutral zinc metallopeptidase [Planctomycetes bacterium Pla86]
MFSFGWIFVTLVALGLSLLASARVKRAFAKYQQVGVRSGMTGAQAAAAVARAGGALDVTIERHQGFLSDHYDPTSRTLRLSPAVYDGRSVSSIAVAAHEAGHAIQHVESYAWLGMRSTLVPAVQIGSGLWGVVFMVGAMLTFAGAGLGKPVMALGIGLFGLLVLFQLVTLPVEFDASRRAKAVLASTGIVSTTEEAQGVETVLGAAALTYVAAAAGSLLQLAYLILQFTGMNRSD